MAVTFQRGDDRGDFGLFSRLTHYRDGTWLEPANQLSTHVLPTMEAVSTPPSLASVAGLRAGRVGD